MMKVSKDIKEDEEINNSDNMSKRYMQLFNSRSKKWVKLDKETESIVAVKSSKSPYKNIPVYKKKRWI